MDREIAVIDHLARGVGIVRAGIGEGRAGLFLRIVAGVGGRGGVAVRTAPSTPR